MVAITSKLPRYRACLITIGVIQCLMAIGILVQRPRAALEPFGVPEATLASL